MSKELLVFMKVKYFCGLCTFILLILPVFSGSSFSYNSSIDYSFNEPININSYDYNGSRISVSFFQGSSLTILDISGQNKQSYTIQLPFDSTFQLNKLKVAHITDSQFLIVCSGYENGTETLKSFKYNLNIIVPINQSFSVTNVNSFEFFNFKSNIYMYLTTDGVYQIFLYNQTLNNWSEVFSLALQGLNLIDFGVTSGNVLISFQNTTEIYFGNVYVLNYSNGFSINHVYQLHGYAYTVAPLNDSFLVLNGSSLLEIKPATGDISLLSNNIGQIPSGEFSIMRAYSDQEVFIQDGNYVTCFIIVNNVVAKVWDISVNYNLIFFNAFYKTREFMIFVEESNFNQQYPNSGFLILNPAMSDPTNSLSSLGLLESSMVGPTTYYDYASPTTDNFGFGFVFGVVLTLVIKESV